MSDKERKVTVTIWITESEAQALIRHLAKSELMVDIGFATSKIEDQIARRVLEALKVRGKK